MTTTTLIFIILFVLVIGISTIKSTLAKSAKAVVRTVDNGAETLFTASEVGKVKSQAYLLDDIEKDVNKVNKLKEKYPNFFIS